MEVQTKGPQVLKPIITDYTDAVEFIEASIAYFRANNRSYSVLNATKGLRRVSPTLISLIIHKKRNITIDRADELAKFLQLTPAEKTYFKQMIQPDQAPGASSSSSPRTPKEYRKEVSTHLLTDWLNVYVKDCFQIKALQENPELIYKQLNSIAPKRRIDKSIQFLIHEGHLRKTPEGKLVTDTPLAVTSSQLPSRKIRQFHKNALSIARNALDIYSIDERMTNTLVMPLNDQSYAEFCEIIKEFASRIQEFAESLPEEGERLYQVTVSLNPTGGKTS